MLGFKQKLILAFGGMLIILVAVGSLGAFLLTEYSSTIEQLTRANYDSVIYGQKMKDAVDEMNDYTLQLLWDRVDESSLSLGELKQKHAALFASWQKFENSLQLEAHNITLPGEDKIVQSLKTKWQEYKGAHQLLLSSASSALGRKVQYRRTIEPITYDLKQLAQRVIDINLANIVSVDGQIKEKTTFARSTMIALVASGLLLAILLTSSIGQAILKPLRMLTESAQEIARGNLNLVVAAKTNDELGDLAHAFNAMAVKLRELRSHDRANLLRVQRTTQLALNTFPDAAIIVRPDGKIELANEAAARRFGIYAGSDLASAGIKDLWQLFQLASTTLQPVQSKSYDDAIQIFDGNNELFYLPQAVPIVTEEKSLAGITIVLADVTNLRRLDEMKSNLLAVASHELKTPLTSIRMASHLLLQERLGPLTEMQSELVVTARDDAERLNTIVEKLLDIGRIEAGSGLMEITLVSPEHLVEASVAAFRAAYLDRGVTLHTEVESGIPHVLADVSRLQLVFSNLLDNALKYTQSGGHVTVTAKLHPSHQYIHFAVADTGGGIPAEYLPRIFEKFFRLPQQDLVRGAGLGLAIAKEIMTAHGTTIDVSSTVGKGSIFSFNLQTKVSYEST